METVGLSNLSIFGAPGIPATGYTSLLLDTGQTTCSSVFDDGDQELGVDKGYTVNALAGNTDIQVAHLASNTISFTAPNTITSAGLFGTWAVNDRMVIKGSVSNDGEVLVTGLVGAPNTLQVSAAVNEIAGRMISLYKVAAHSNAVVTDTKTGRVWSRNTSTGEKVGVLSNGTLNWYDVATRYIIYAGANTVSCIAASNIFRVIGGAALTQFHPGDCIQVAGFANAVNGLPNYYLISATPNGLDMDLLVNPGNEVLIAEGAVGDTIYLNCRSIYNYMAGAWLAGLSGYTDWRVPYDVEMKSLMDMEAASALPDAIAFPAWTTAVHWSATTCPNLATSAERANFSSGAISEAVKTTAYLTALVRN